MMMRWRVNVEVDGSKIPYSRVIAADDLYPDEAAISALEDVSRTAREEEDSDLLRALRVTITVERVR